MISSTASRTSLAAAAARAAHLLVDGEPALFRDPLAATLLGAGAEPFLEPHRTSPRRIAHVGMRVVVTCRSRYTEDALAAALDRGIGQYVLLGAGADTFAYRSPFAARLRVYEVDHPSTQAWKRRHLAEAGLAVGDHVTFVPADLARDPLLDRLAAAGFDLTRPAFVACLGVVQYLRAPAIAGIATAAAALAEGSELVLEHQLPRAALDKPDRRFFDACTLGATLMGEPWLSLLTSDEIAALLRSHGFTAIRRVPLEGMVGPTLWQRADGLRPMTATAIAHATR